MDRVEPVEELAELAKLFRNFSARDGATNMTAANPTSQRADTTTTPPATYIIIDFRDHPT